MTTRDRETDAVLELQSLHARKKMLEHMYEQIMRDETIDESIKKFVTSLHTLALQKYDAMIQHHLESNDIFHNQDGSTLQ